MPTTHQSAVPTPILANYQGVNSQFPIPTWPGVHTPTRPHHQATLILVTRSQFLIPAAAAALLAAILILAVAAALVAAILILATTAALRVASVPQSTEVAAGLHGARQGALSSILVRDVTRGSASALLRRRPRTQSLPLGLTMMAVKAWGIWSRSS